MEETTNTIEHVEKTSLPITFKLKGVRWNIECIYDELEFSMDIDRGTLRGVKGMVIEALINKTFNKKGE